MEHELEMARKAIEAQKEELEKMKKQTKEERRERAKAAFKVTEGIASEREDLVKQLEALRFSFSLFHKTKRSKAKCFRQVNKKLIDERDEIRVSHECLYGTVPCGTDFFAVAT